jgi:hypothetical protein
LSLPLPDAVEGGGAEAVIEAELSDEADEAEAMEAAEAPVVVFRR